MIDYQPTPWHLVSPTHVTVACGTTNLGDDIQSEAQRRLWEVDLFLNRDKPKEWPRDGRIPLCGWFGHAADPFDTNATVFIVGFHCQAGSVKRLFGRRQWLADTVREQGFPAFCRDTHTRDLIRSMGVDAEFGGCVTLTLQRTTPYDAEGRELCIDLPDVRNTELPLSNTCVGLQSCSTEERLERARLRITDLETARSVRTSRLHIWLPCLALDVPAALKVHPHTFQPERFSGHNTESITKKTLLAPT